MPNSVRVWIIFRWYDLWVGIYKDPKRKRLYLFPVPMIGFVFDWEPKP